MATNQTEKTQTDTNRKNNSTANWLLDLNSKQSELYTSPGATIERRSYRENHPTEFSAFKCMDGRLNLSIYTETPPGVIKPFRTMGGVFDLGDGDLGKIIEEDVERCIKNGKKYIPLCTYHFSKGSHHRGCAGHDYDTQAALLGAKRLVKQFLFAYCATSISGVYNKKVVYPILVGVETDREALIFHANDGRIFSAEDYLEKTESQAKSDLSAIFSDMSEEMLEDLFELVKGNIHHIKQVIAKNRPPVDLEHQESVICFGRGFDWLHTPNKALIIGPYGRELEKSIIKAAGLLISNIEKGRVDSKNGLVVMTAGLYHDQGMYKNRAMLKSYNLYLYIKNVIEKNVPELEEKYNVQYLTGVTSHDTREFTEISVSDFEKSFDRGFEISSAEKACIESHEIELAQ